MPLPPFLKKRGPRGGNSFSYKENLAGAPLIIKTIQSPLFLKKVESEGIAKAVQSVLFLEKWGPGGIAKAIRGGIPTCPSLGFLEKRGTHFF